MTCVLFLAGLAAQATTIVLPTDDQLIAKSPVIVDGTVLSTQVVETHGAIWTEAVVSVARQIKGETPSTITVREPGGELGERITKIYGTPEFLDGERVLLFLEESPRGGYRTIDFFIGKFTEASTTGGQRLWLRDTAGADVVLLDHDLQPLRATNVQRDAAAFEQFVFDRLAGRPAVGAYGVENPLLQRRAAIDMPGPGRVSSEFTLISEPTIYRWFRFDSGQTAQWYSSGTQPGYSNGGGSELQTAMGSWNNYSSAKINYAYAGNRTGSMGGLNSPNTVNEVLFNDPLDEISGTWNPSTGGVVGTGGFNGVAAQRDWIAPFAADSTHPAGTLRAWNITEGNLTIQDGVSSTKSISSSRLAEIIAHELGHTLGFGHSAESGALMYAYVTGAGPSLRADDQLAARWLYPNGGSTPPPTVTLPAAPSNLAGTFSGSQIDLTWKDNANNETSQSVYVNAGDGFENIGSLAANTTSARLSGAGAGTYRIYIVASNSAGDSAPSNTVTVTASTPPAQAAFTMQQVAGTTYNFIDQSTGTVASWLWRFGDGATSTQQSPQHAYASSGEYTVTLTVTGGGASSSKSQTLAVSGALTAAYSFSPVQPTTNDTIQFTDQSTGGPTSWLWSFGDGSGSSQQNPTKKYASQGSYTVTLTISRNGQSATKSATVGVAASAPVTPAIVAAFDTSASNPTVGSAVSFTDRSTGSPTQWVWSFGDGATSTQRNPQHAYSGPGTYMVSLTASNATSSSSATRQISVGGIVPFRTLVSVAAATGGVGGTSWRTELSLFNAGAQGASVVLTFLPSGVTRSVFLSPKQSTTYENALSDLFGMASGAGALAIEASSAGASADVRVASRTFTTGSRGTYGQSVPDIEPASLEKTQYITGIAASGDFRTNIGLVNRSGATVSTSFALLNSKGSVVASNTVSLAPNSFQQTPLAALFPEIATSTYAVLTMRISSASADAVSAYASVVDNATQDPIYIQAVPPAGGQQLVIPVVGRSPGVNGTYWRSDLTLFNSSTSQVTLTVRYGGVTRQVVIGGNDTEVLADVLSVFGQTSGSGALEVSWSSSNGPVVTSRTYTSVATGGTYGQSIDPVARLGTIVFVPGMRNDASYRSNVGFFNGGSETENISVSLLSPSGTELGRTMITLAAGQQAQYNAAGLFPDASLPAGFTLQAQGDSNARLFAYGSMIDNASGDPVFFAGR